MSTVPTHQPTNEEKLQDEALEAKHGIESAALATARVLKDVMPSDISNFVDEKGVHSINETKEKICELEHTIEEVSLKAQHLVEEIASQSLHSTNEQWAQDKANEAAHRVEESVIAAHNYIQEQKMREADRIQEQLLVDERK